MGAGEGNIVICGFVMRKDKEKGCIVREHSKKGSAEQRYAESEGDWVHRSWKERGPEVNPFIYGSQERGAPKLTRSFMEARKGVHRG